MKFYVYIADAKVDMLFPEVPHDIKKKIAVEFKTDFKVFSASRKSETESDENRIARLEAVVDFLNQYGDVGTVDKPGSYFADTLDMRWGDYGSSGDHSVVYFGGQTKHTSVGLGGSKKHLLGGSGPDSPFPGSLMPFLLQAMSADLEIPEPQLDAHLAARPDAKDFAWRAIELANQNMRSTPQKLEFFAKRLHHWQDFSDFSGSIPEGITSVLLGSPLYVAMAD